MTILRIELWGPFRILSCESCGWVGTWAAPQCPMCKRKFTQAVIVTPHGKTELEIEGGPETDPFSV